MIITQLKRKKRKKKKKKKESREREREGERLCVRAREKSTRNSKTNDEKRRDETLHVDVRMSMHVYARVCAFLILSFTIYTQH